MKLTEQLARSLRDASRYLRFRKGFTIMVALSLALGIGANTAIFSLINAVMLKTLPVRNPHELVLLKWHSPGGLPPKVTQSGDYEEENGYATSTSFSYPMFESLLLQNDRQPFANVFAFAPSGRVNITIDEETTSVDGEMVTADYFAGLGVSPILGRTISYDDFAHNTPDALVIGQAFWTRALGSDPRVIGKSVVLNGFPSTIVGVLPASFFGFTAGKTPDVWMPLVDQPQLRPRGLPSASIPGSLFRADNWWWLTIAGRLRPGVTQAEALATVDVPFRQHVARVLGPDSDLKTSLKMEIAAASKGIDTLRREFSKLIFPLTTIVVLVLFISCANVATLLLAHAESRRKEIALRLAFGASRLHLIWQLLTESLLLASLGGAIAFLLAYWASRAGIIVISSSDRSLTVHSSLDWTVFAYTAALSVLSGIAFGVAPALSATKLDVARQLNEDSVDARATRSRIFFGVSRPLVATQVASSMILLVISGLFVRTLSNLESQKLGFDPANLLIIDINSQNEYQGTRLLNVFQLLLNDMSAVPGVRSVTLGEFAPLSGAFNNGPISLEGRGLDSHNNDVSWSFVGPDFFKTLGIKILLGRGTQIGDGPTSSKVAVINATASREFFGDENPIGQRFSFGRRVNPEAQFEIVGVVEDVKLSYLRGKTRKQVFVPYTQAPTGIGRTYLIAKTQGDATALIIPLRKLIQQIAPELPILDVRTQIDRINESLMRERLFAHMSGLFSMLALTLASIGVYGLVAYFVANRTKEIGIRIALGARHEHIFRMVIGQCLFLVILGIAIGTAGALAAGRLISSMLFGVKATDPLTIILTILLMAAVAAFAAYVPARRAARLEPMVTLKHQSG